MGFKKVYTQTPWKVERRAESGDYIVTTDDRVQTHIAYIVPANGLGYETDDVLSLIGAASDLQAALAALVDKLRGWPMPGMRDEYEAAVRALILAEGGKRD